MNTRARLRTALICIVLLAGLIPAQVAAQGTGDTQLFLPAVGVGIGRSPHVTYDVTYRPETIVVAPETVASDLISTSEDGLEYHFRSTAADIGELQAGDIVIFSGLALRKILNVATVGDEFVVSTEETSLDQAINDGTIAWNYPVQWLELPASSYVTAAGPDFELVEIQGFDARGEPLRQAALPPEISFQGTIEGWEVALKLKPTAERLNIDLTAKRVAGVAQAAVSGKGWISTFNQDAAITYAAGSLDTVAMESSGLNGEMELKWAAVATDGSALTTIVQFQIPLEIPIPITIGPIPVQLKIKAVLQVVPELRFDQSSSGGSWKATYNSDQGFQWKDNAVNVTGEVKSANLDTSGDTVSAGYGPVAFGLGVEFPRLEVTVFGVATAFITLKSYGTSIFLLEPPCQKGSLLLLSVAGFSFKVLNLSIGSGQQELWRREIIKYKDNEAC